MPSYYVYLHPTGEIAETVRRYFDSLKVQVQSQKMPDMLSLQYPPHITLAMSFDMEEKDVLLLVDDIRDVFATPFISGVAENKQRISAHSNIITHNFEWAELSERVDRLRELYPRITWVVSGYHMTLAHSPITNEKGVAVAALQRAHRMLPRYPLFSRDFSVTVWKHAHVESQNTWSSRVWTEIATFPLTQY
jgi:2'-5' RNA ligase